MLLVLHVGALIFTCSKIDTWEFWHISALMQAVRETSHQRGQSASHGKGEEDGFRQVQINTDDIKEGYLSICTAL